MIFSLADGVSGFQLMTSSRIAAFLQPECYQLELCPSRVARGDVTCRTAFAGEILAHPSTPTLRAGVLAIFDRRAAEQRGLPLMWRCARRSDRPKQPRMSLRASVVYDRKQVRIVARKCTRQWPPPLAAEYHHHLAHTSILPLSERLSMVSASGRRRRCSGGLPWPPTAISFSDCSRFRMA
jgi:hypothetical protein